MNSSPDTYINSFTKTAYYCLRNIARLHPLLSNIDAKVLVNAFKSRSDCKSLFNGLPVELLSWCLHTSPPSSTSFTDYLHLPVSDLLTGLPAVPCSRLFITCQKIF
ncbi:hypothetical protein MHYP_G00173780 [Metynnis hypsauchen]